MQPHNAIIWSLRMSTPDPVSGMRATVKIKAASIQRPVSKHHVAGFSLVELMVGIVIALLGSIVIFQVFSVSENYKRISVSGSDAQQNGAIGLLAIERDLHMAGFGINDLTLMGCTVQAYNQNLVPTDFTFPLLPVQIVQGAGNNATTGVGTASDTVSVMYGSAGTGMASVNIIENMASSDAAYRISNRYGVRVGEFVVAAEAGLDCTLSQVTSLPGGGNADTVPHDTGNYTNEAGGVVPATFNKPGGSGVSYTANGRLYNLGLSPGRNTYAIQNNTLIVRSGLIETTVEVADNIVSLQALYCKDLVNTPPTNFTTCNATPPVSWDQVGSVIIGLVARSAKPEIDNVTASSSIAWPGGTFDVSADPNWRRYRYKLFQTTVPLRNFIWRPS